MFKMCIKTVAKIKDSDPLINVVTTSLEKPKIKTGIMSFFVNDPKTPDQQRDQFYNPTEVRLLLSIYQNLSYNYIDQVISQFFHDIYTPNGGPKLGDIFSTSTKHRPIMRT